MRSEPTLVALIMAAGVGRRFGSDKRRQPLADGRTLLATTLAATAAAYPRHYVVLRPDETPAALGLAPNTPVLSAPAAAHGLGASLGDAFRQLLTGEPDATAAAVILGDMPWLSAASCAQLNARASATAIVVPCYAGQRGHPVIFGRHWWPELAQLKTGEGARAVLARRQHAVQTVELDDPGVRRDVDRPQDLPG
ncbi:nucleotidyltransferase family protein [Salinicola endophyticus]|uniref:Nucleotidyltransferase family protein n=1 Tax=Salinicola endophyticus TaxID=1949083 RepID=A0ABY8FLS1_9GAMM|nr:nucleotidyltransferase family protein [Salinicola endophyticus]WFF42141.1 nucleotidyltransferase family protein [Salinicola endophyticus]